MITDTELLEQVREAAMEWPRCCDLWQDGLGGMHCRDCSQKTFAMFRKIQTILGIRKDGKPKTELPTPG